MTYFIQSHSLHKDYYCFCFLSNRQEMAMLISIHCWHGSPHVMYISYPRSVSFKVHTIQNTQLHDPLLFLFICVVGVTDLPTRYLWCCKSKLFISCLNLSKWMTIRNIGNLLNAEETFCLRLLLCNPLNPCCKQIWDLEEAAKKINRIWQIVLLQTDFQSCSKVHDEVKENDNWHLVKLPISSHICSKCRQREPVWNYQDRTSKSVSLWV